MAEYFCRDGAREFGPLSADELRELAASGVLTRAGEVREGRGMAWLPATNVVGLFEFDPVDELAAVVADLEEAAVEKAAGALASTFEMAWPHNHDAATCLLGYACATSGGGVRAADATACSTRRLIRTATWEHSPTVERRPRRLSDGAAAGQSRASSSMNL